MRKLSLLLLLGAMAGLFPGAAPAGALHVVIAEAGGVRLKALLYLPRGAQAAPAIVALHGCGGPLPRRDDGWARYLARRGHAVLLPDSFSSRDEGGECRAATHGTSAYGPRREDALAAAAWLQRRPGSPAGGVVLLGWSDGGTTVLAAINRSTAPRGLIRGAIAFYPACFRTLRMAERGAWAPGVPLYVLMGSADDWTPPRPCDDLARRFGGMIHLHLYPAAYHDFDVPLDPVHLVRGLPYTLRHDGTAHAGENPAAREQALAAVPAILAALPGA